MGYTKRVWEIQQGLDQLSHEINERRSVLNKIGWQTSEEGFVKSMERFLALAKLEDNLAILSPITTALCSMSEIAERTWGWRKLGQEASKKFTPDDVRIFRAVNYPDGKCRCCYSTLNIQGKKVEFSNCTCPQDCIGLCYAEVEEFDKHKQQHKLTQPQTCKYCAFIECEEHEADLKREEETFKRNSTHIMKR